MSHRIFAHRRSSKYRLLLIAILALLVYVSQISVQGMSPGEVTPDQDELTQSSALESTGGVQNLDVSNAVLSFTQQATTCPGDFDGNGMVNIADFLLFTGVFGTSSGDANYNALMDMDGNGEIGIADFLLFTGVFGTTCEVSSQQYDEFTSSQGRTIRYRLYFDDAWNPREPRGLLIFFHGTNNGTEQQMLEWFRGFAQLAQDEGLAYAVVASPASEGEGHPFRLLGSLLNGGGRRYWVPRDYRLVHELLQSGFNGSMVIDYDSIVFYGGSQGTIFLIDFVERYAGVYGGGLWASCGGVGDDGVTFMRDYGLSEWEPLFSWTPSSSAFVRERFRVFVEATTGDFLHTRAVLTAHYYSEILGLDVEAELEAPGGHCADGLVKWTRRQVVPWLADGGRQMRTQIPRDGDADGDGIEDERDSDADGDGSLNFIDALPLDARDWLDTDADGIGNFMDRDADGDGVDNAADPFPLDPGESRDTDGDGVGDNLDDDDSAGLALKRVMSSYAKFPSGIRSSKVHARKPPGIRYPPPEGNRQVYLYLELGNGEVINIMVDRFDRDEHCETTLIEGLCGDNDTKYAGYWDEYIDKIWVDRNNNSILTDDGPPLVLGPLHVRVGWRPAVTTDVKVSYASGKKLPYWLQLSVHSDLARGVRYFGGSIWTGSVETPAGERILVATADLNADGLFDSEDKDIVCIDLDRNGAFNECLLGEDRRTRPGAFRPGEYFILDGHELQVIVSPSGQDVEIIAAR